MPCTDPYADEEAKLERDRKYREVVAMLCGFASALERRGKLSGALAAIDWDEVGVSEAHFRGWWHSHKAEDAERKRREQASAAAQATRQRALEKLTPAERRALGV